ncbi:hypothetical protein [Yoonia sp.]|uniref:hypothetical protein n=1 Tax=Yoonia sp. TaxID=2212373 RepID=UPI003975F640
MSFQFSPNARNAALDAIEAAIGAAPKLQLRSGALPANTGAADAGNLLVEIALPSDWLETAATGIKTIKGTWTGTGAAAAAGGTNAGHFRIKNTAGTTTHVQGTITITGAGGDMELDNPNIAQNQSVTVTTFTLTAGGA